MSLEAADDVGGDPRGQDGGGPQRYDVPWDGLHGAKGSSRLLGTVGAVYGTPTRYDITIYRVTLSAYGMAQGWTHDLLSDDALQHGGTSLARCPRTMMAPPPEPLRLASLAAVG